MKRGAWIVGIVLGAIGCGGGAGNGSGSVTGQIGSHSLAVHSVGYVEGSEAGTIEVYLTDSSDVCSQLESGGENANQKVLRIDLRLDNGALPTGDYTDDNSFTSKLPGVDFYGFDGNCLPGFYVVSNSPNSVVHVTTGFKAGSTGNIAGSFSLDFGANGALNGNFTAVHRSTPTPSSTGSRTG